MIANRRQLISLMGAGSLTAPLLFPQQKNKEDSKEAEVSPSEDLMREHGILKRVLLTYREVMRRIDAHQEFPPDAVSNSAKLIRQFVEDYHEKLEEDYLFPRFRSANRLLDLFEILKAQHQKGRTLTDRIMQLASDRALKDSGQEAKLRESLDLFVRMYEPHEAREDTVLFPEFRKIVSRSEYDSLGEDFERKEKQQFGSEGFEKNVNAIAAIEKRLGVYDLAQFTPRV